MLPSLPRCAIVVAIAAFITTVPLKAQTPATVTNLNTGHVSGNYRLDTFRKLYFDGQYDILAKEILTALTSITYDNASGETLSVQGTWLSIALVATAPTQKDPTVVRFVVSPEAKITAPPLRLPGLSTVTEVILLDDPKSSVSVAWISTPQVDPKQAQILKLAESTVGSFAGLLQGLTVKEVGQEKAAFYLSINRVSLPHKRATIQVTTRVSGVDNVTLDDFQGAALDLEAELGRTNVRLSPCAQAISNALVALIEQQKTPLLLSADRKALSQRAKKVISDTIKGTTCLAEATAASDGTLQTAQGIAANDVATRFIALITGSPTPVLATTEIRNSPTEHFSFGIVAGGIVSRKGVVRAEVSDGKLVSKPVTGLVTAAVVHLHPLGFDSQAADMEKGERWSLFSGFVTTPSPGVTLGTSMRIYRNFGLQFSHDWLLVDRPERGFTINQAITTDDDPLRNGVTRLWVVGITYDLK